GITGRNLKRRCVMQSWTSRKKSWSCYVIPRVQGLSKSHLKLQSYKIGNSFVRSEGELSLPVMVGQPTWLTTVSLWSYPNQTLIRLSCKRCKVAFPNA